MALSLTSWFFHPAVVGMTRHEPLSRASAFAIRAAIGSPVTHHVCSAAHVTHPFRYPAYYPGERHVFVHALGEQDVRCTIERRLVSSERAKRVRAAIPARLRVFDVRDYERGVPQR